MGHSYLAVGMVVVCLNAVIVRAAEDIFAVSAAREKQLIDGHLKEAADLLDANKLQQTRATLRLVDDRLAVVRRNLPKAERQDIEARRDAVVARMRAKEDSLVAAAKGKVAAEGLDAAIEYSQQVLRRIGLPEERFQEIDRFLLEEAPKLRQKKESEAIGRVVQALEQGRQVPDDVDPYLVMTARQIVQARRDSARAAKERERVRDTGDAKRGKEAQRAAAAERKKQEARARDSLAGLERERTAMERRQREEHARAERDQTAAAAAQRGYEARLAAQKDEEAELRRQTAEERVGSPERASASGSSEMIAVGAQESVSGARMTVGAETSDENEIGRRREEDERIRQAQAREREKRVEEMRRDEQRIAALEKFSRGQTTFQETEQAGGTTASVREYMRQRKEEESRAQAVAVQVYELLERRKPAEALALFRARRDYLGQYLSKEVFVVLEQSVVAAAASTSSGLAAAADDTASRPSLQELPKEEQYVMRIRGYLSERKWESAVSLFDATERALKKYMVREEFLRLKSMVASARQYVGRK